MTVNLRRELEQEGTSRTPAACTQPGGAAHSSSLLRWAPIVKGHIFKSENAQKDANRHRRPWHSWPLWNQMVMIAPSLSA